MHIEHTVAQPISRIMVRAGTSSLSSSHFLSHFAFFLINNKVGHNKYTNTHTHTHTHTRTRIDKSIISFIKFPPHKVVTLLHAERWTYSHDNIHRLDLLTNTHTYTPTLTISTIYNTKQLMARDYNIIMATWMVLQLSEPDRVSTTRYGFMNT